MTKTILALALILAMPAWAGHPDKVWCIFDKYERQIVECYPQEVVCESIARGKPALSCMQVDR